MNTITLDYFGMIPNDILHIILSFVDSLKDSFSLLLVSKRFYHLVKPNQLQWKVLCLQFWKDYKQQLTQKDGNDYSKEGEYDLEWVQRESGKDWFWFSKYFMNGRVSEKFYSILIGMTPGKEVNGWGIQIQPTSAYIGTSVESVKNGIGILVFNSGDKYEGEWSESKLHGLGSITYPDGIQYEGQWNMYQPGCMDCFIF